MCRRAPAEGLVQMQEVVSGSADSPQLSSPAEMASAAESFLAWGHGLPQLACKTKRV